MAQHVEIGPAARIAAKSGVTRNLAGGNDYGGIPAVPIAQWRRTVALWRRLAKGYLKDH